MDSVSFVMDWRGQGGSDRPLKNPAQRATSTIFRCLSAIWKRWSSRSWSPFVRGHGSGSRIRWARRCCSAADAAGRSPFDRLVLTSPMIAVKGIDHRGPARYVIEALDALGLGGAFAPGYGPKNLWSAPFEGNVVTTDPARFSRIARLAEAAPGPGPRRTDGRLGACGLSGAPPFR